MCLLSDAELYCVSTNMRLILLFMQLEIGISTNLYFPAIGTAGLLLVAVSGYSLEPAPPPKITATTCLLVMVLFILNRIVKINILLCTCYPAVVNLHHLFSYCFHLFFVLKKFKCPLYRNINIC